MSEQELKIRTMFVSERLEMRLQGSPEPENDKGYTMYPNWQLRMEITDTKALEQRVERLETALAATPAVIPTTWLDPLLTGPDAVLDECDCPSLEQLLLTLQENLKSHAKEALAEKEA